MTKWLYNLMWDIKPSNFDNISKELNYEDEGELESDLSISQEKVIYEQALVSLVSIFEAFVKETLRWIIDMLDIPSDDHIPQLGKIRGWHRLIEAFNNEPIGINWGDSDLYKNSVAEKILRRNLLIHSRNKVNEIVRVQ